LNNSGVFKRVLVIVNPEAGGARRGAIDEALDRVRTDFQCRIRTLEADEDAEQVTREELRQSWDVVLAAGGDGTVSRVARAAREFEVPVAIAPMGTGNILADQLGIPRDVRKAVGLLEGESRIRRLDGMEVDGQLHFLNVGIGVSATTVRTVSDDHKRRFGLSAYVWTGMLQTLLFRPVPCTVAIDGRAMRLRILDVSIINAGFRFEPPFPGVPDIRPDDGRLDVMVVWAPRPLEYLRHLAQVVSGSRRFNPNVQWVAAKGEVSIESGEELPVQADGDPLGETPVTVRLVSGAVSVVVPA
jgi:diacylglycerol kinase (ATP)